jgi:DNA-binding CsgD family transcriptional regulator
METNQDYSLLHQFIKTYSPICFVGINRDDSLLVDLEKMMKDNDQFFFIGDVIHFKVLFTSKRSTQIIGVEPDNVIPHLFFEATHPDDIHRYSLARTKLTALAQEFFIDGKGTALMSVNLKIRDAEGKYKCLLFQCYLFYSETPVKTVYILQLHTSVDWCKKIIKEPHYYLGEDMSNFRYPDEKLLEIGSIFTKREFEIIKLIELGYNTEQLADKLFVSTNTINVHRGNIIKKSGKARISELIHELRVQGML